MELLALESIVLTQLKTRVPKILDNKYPTISFTNEISDKTPDFPNVYIHQLEPSEVGNTLMNDEVHAIRDTVQIEVTTNTGQSDARTVINACIKVMKVLHYSIPTLPIHSQSNNLHRFIIRARRNVASGDTF